jgi:hypothetical protein
VARESKAGSASTSTTHGGARLGVEAELWLAAEYKHVVLGQIFLKYISDTFEEQRAELQLDFTDPSSEWYVSEEPAVYDLALEDRDEYAAKGVFWVPKEARWRVLQAHAKSGYTDRNPNRHKDIGVLLDDAGAVRGGAEVGRGDSPQLGGNRVPRGGSRVMLLMSPRLRCRIGASREGSLHGR